MNIGNIVENEQFYTVLDRAIEDRITDIRTAIPAKITKINHKKNVVDVDILIDEWIGSKTEKIDTLKEVPILQLGNKKIFITIPIKEGDEGLLIFNDRSIDEHENGFEKTRDNRSHNVSDAVFIPMELRYKKDLIEDFNKDNLEIRLKKRDDMVLAFNPDNKEISVDFKKDKHTVLIKKDNIELLANDEKTKIEVKKESIKISVNDDLKLEIKDDKVIILEKAIFQDEVTFVKKATFVQGFEAFVNVEITGNLKVVGNVDLLGATKINGIVQVLD